MKEKLRRIHSIPLEFNEKIFMKAGDYRIYRDAVIITPGVHTDSVSMMPITYTQEALARYGARWTDNNLNVDHFQDTMSHIGFVYNGCFYNGAVCGDLYINPHTQKGRDVITKIDMGELNHLSAELLSYEEWEGDSIYATDIEFVGCAVTRNPADPQTRIT